MCTITFTFTTSYQCSTETNTEPVAYTNENIVLNEYRKMKTNELKITENELQV